MILIDSKLRELGQSPSAPIRLDNHDLRVLRRPSQELHSHKAVRNYIHTIALSETLRRIARLFPSNISHALANITQWVSTEYRDIHILP